MKKSHVERSEVISLAFAGSGGAFSKDSSQSDDALLQGAVILGGCSIPGNCHLALVSFAEESRS